MPTALRPVSHEDRLSLVEHLTELRTRLVLCLVVYLAAFGVCFWQNDRILKVVNQPLEDTAFKKGSDSQDSFETAQRFNNVQRQVLRLRLPIYRELARKHPADRALYDRLEALDRTLLAAAPKASARKPVTLGVGEPFVATFKLAAWAAALLAMPLILFQMYAFILPAFSPREREVALPLMAMVPFLFVAGVVFCYFVVLPNAVDFLQNFNDDQFDILLQAKDYYKFAVLAMAALGVLFQIPVGVLALTRMEIVTTKQLRANRRYAILVIAVLAMLLPGTDPITMLLGMLPLVVLFEGSILLAALFERRTARAAAIEEAALVVSEDRDDKPEKEVP